jgi:hypothetical protein
MRLVNYCVWRRPRLTFGSWERIGTFNCRLRAAMHLAEHVYPAHKEQFEFLILCQNEVPSATGPWPAPAACEPPQPRRHGR